ncbi:MAG: DUF1684 domain-containing protein [Haloplanus sp.]
MSETPDDYAARLREHRAEKDRVFAESRGSPLPPEERDDFDGLPYFDPNPDYRVDATVTVSDDPVPVEMETSDGRTVRYLRIVTFEFALDGDTHTLHGYRQEGADSDDIFVPFRDKTTGQQTYRGGRYMELEPHRALDDGDRVPLDFNLAYTPFCAFSDAFSCPLPPEENWLETTIPAGERSPNE